MYLFGIAQTTKMLLSVCLSMSAVVQGVTKKKPDCINHAFGTMAIGKPLAHRETQLLNSIGLQFR